MQLLGGRGDTVGSPSVSSAPSMSSVGSSIPSPGEITEPIDDLPF
ncbi:MAG: hypothetical protein WDO19_06665 [Bacteroidota bacterium]